ncbi:Rieske 2Fe-2S domain-containing protein [Glacieibacterium frigidum]|uniref:Rieske 2Fe-2S domain-containing protein n=1 Tax=Glacieibacterium frigidum TaxID=2593303 RepID=A0A552UF98_9SPHN|nr:Rieske 2Fe-2S domain-containing protein [Glacieibacterium frigidum]TRW16895.1 Rieske 2Fe-2S domain-containing protein [Glacieibacterium frigidum]
MAALNLAGTYVRDVRANMARIWENVLDWEHLPALHASSFAGCDLVEARADGWRIRLRGHGGPDQQLRLDCDFDGGQYRVTTEAGPGETSEIRVALTPTGAHATHVVVDYHVPVADPERLAMIGRGFVAAYERLWDEDEAMMRHREAALAPRARVAVPERVDLGEARAGTVFDFGPGRFRLVEMDGALVAHSVVCPHWLGPLDDAAVVDGCVTCPWHGYRFDVTTGRSADGRGLRLGPAPRIAVEDGRVVAYRA